MTTLDRQTIESFRISVGDEAFGDIVRDVIRDSETLLVQLHDGAKRADCDEVQTATHQMRSTALLLGAADLATACADLEELCEEEHPRRPVVREKLDLVSRRFSSARRALLRELSRAH